ncbi:barstar family protein [Dehalogenimonas etheniformans]|nr:barstar family protein [Dehalogenimonas etheniformans]
MTSLSFDRISTKLGFLRRVAKVFHFPVYFGHNWDALKDSLTDLSWKPAKGYVILITHFQSLKNKMPEDFEVIKEIFRSSASYWKDQGKPFFVILLDG